MTRIARPAPLCAALIFALVVLGVLVGCGGSSGSDGSSGSGDSSGGSSAGGPTVGIIDSSIGASSVEIQAGESVTWTNNDPLIYWLVGEGGIDSGELRQSFSYTKVFDTPGTYEYACKLHPSVKGEVIVK